jgi:ankyrin repeat protein
LNAAILGDTATVSALLAAPGILVNQADNFGLTALMYAARHGHTATVTALLAAPGILVNQANNNDWTALMYAAMHGHTATVTALLAAPGILVNQAIIMERLRSYRPSRITILPPSQPYSLLPVF